MTLERRGSELTVEFQPRRGGPYKEKGSSQVEVKGSGRIPTCRSLTGERTRSIKM